MSSPAHSVRERAFGETDSSTMMDRFLSALFGQLTKRQALPLHRLCGSDATIVFTMAASSDRSLLLKPGADVEGKLVKAREFLIGRICGWQEQFRVEEEIGDGHSIAHSNVSTYAGGGDWKIRSIDIFMTLRCDRLCLRPIAGVVVSYGDVSTASGSGSISSAAIGGCWEIPRAP
ncbi:hypothetical protein [Dokdonella fugitiva]|jgi:alkylated DNA nucleotide flippase Atl1|uniref:Uncharacterized protein n=1 Tax=Dokdonella fugitiva TaxID=328517 RepID=A0A4V2S2R7_9GAMM|nr:hypothetical protein [Dokdonella fugitiva]TCO41460.1 hypothetical protein EV148_103380 [Dokdonella fugitiva]